MTIQEIKQSLYAYRNGVVADSLRKSGDPHHIIFGLLLPQLTEISKQIGYDEALAHELWNQSSSRECRLLAAMIYPHDKMTIDLGKQWLTESVNKEEIDILCLKLLSKIPICNELACELINTSSENENIAYATCRLVLNLLAQGKIKDKESALTLLSPLAESSLTSVQQMLKQIQEY